ncbi:MULTISPECIES: GntR family transcriptional regulator [unclassified Xanthobacter]|uniref:GntR family transcriptional regulator n=1 Tax=unclassified Xanthobacter TaxID=2623496 RepID=UPI001EDF2F29|nr:MULTISPECIES: GntR family transcriptional regulator [unclassified Xanthobacter]
MSKRSATHANADLTAAAGAEETGEDVISVADRAYKTIEARIVQLKYPPGFPLSEHQLSQELGISRTPVREAFRRLALDQIIEILPRKGAFVTDVEVKQYFHLLDLRQQLELFMAVRAAKRATAEQRETMAQLAAELRAGMMEPEQAIFVYADRAYKDLIVEACRNPFIGNIIAPMHALSRRFWYYYRHQWHADEAQVAINHHLAVMDAVAAGDEAAAGAAVGQLFVYLESFAHRILHNEHVI